MLILPPGHAQQIAHRRRFTLRERWIVGSVLAMAVALVAVVILSVTSSGHSSGNGCVEVNLPYSTGGQEFYACGARARTMCASVGRPGAYTGAAGRAVATQCRKAGLPVGAPSRPGSRS